MDDKTKHINASGFPLQIGVAHAVNATTNKHGWKVLYQEHGWKNPDADESGFIDLVIENQYHTVLLNVECKRPQDATWQFLLPRPNDGKTRACKFWVSFARQNGTEYFDWLDLAIDPPSYESEFCVVAGQDSKNRPMLERVAASVVASTEALAREEGPLIAVEHLRAYINVVVTTAKLEVCKFEPAKIDLQSGMIAEGEYEYVPFMRFRKQLSLKPAYEDAKSLPKGYGWHQMARARENTVLVVEASKFLELLPRLELDKSIGNRILGMPY